MNLGLKMSNGEIRRKFSSTEVGRTWSQLIGVNQFENLLFLCLFPQFSVALTADGVMEIGFPKWKHCFKCLLSFCVKGKLNARILCKYYA